MLRLSAKSESQRFPIPALIIAEAVMQKNGHANNKQLTDNKCFLIQ